MFVGTITTTGALSARRFLPSWYLWLLLGVLEIPLGVLALADPGATLAALITAAGISGVVVGIVNVVLSLEVKRLSADVDEAFAVPRGTTAAHPAAPDGRLAATGS